MIYIISCLFTILFVYYSKYQFKDIKPLRNTTWKSYGVSMRILFFIGCFLCQLFNSTWQDYLLAGSINILLFEIGINLIALNTKIFHIGTTSEFDKTLGKYKWYVMFTLLLITLNLKLWT